MAKKITKKPSPAPRSLAIKKSTDNGGAALTATWGNPADALTDTNHKWAYVDEQWTFNASYGMPKKGSKPTEQRGDAHVTGDVVWVRDKGIHSSNTVWFNRNAYHPVKDKRYLKSVSLTIWAGNAKGKTYVSTSFTFQPPRAPSIAEPELDVETSELTFKVNTNAGADAKDRHDTRVCVTRTDSANRGNSYAKEKTIGGWYTTTATEYEVPAQDVDDAMAITPGQWVKLTCKAFARGCMGDSDVVTKDYLFAYPAQASITDIVASSLDAGGAVTVTLKTNSTATAPIDTIKLQRLANVTIGTATAASSSPDWEDVEGATDNGNSTGFSDSVASAMPSVKKHTWYRLVTTHGALVRYSTPVEAACLYRDREESGNIDFVELAPGEDGTSIRMRLGWPVDNFTTTEVAWSDHADAWESNDPPDTYPITWEDEEKAEGHAHSAAFAIRGLNEGVPVYVRARRLIEEDETRYSGWCSPPAGKYPLTPAAAPTGVVLAAPAAVERGRGIEVSWTHEGGEQTAWRVERVAGSARKVVASGKGTAASATVPAEAIAGLSSVQLVASVTAGGDWASSEKVSVTVMDAPTLSLSAAATLTAQPMSLTLSSSIPTATVLAYVTAAANVSGDAAIGGQPQAEGDVVWSAALDKLAWSAAQGGGYSATVELPSGLDFREGARYQAAASSTDPASGLSSEQATATFGVEWAHQAACPPEDGTAITADPEALTATIVPAAPEGAAATDVCDVYRVTPDGAEMVASGLHFGDMVVDRFAPYAQLPGAELAYRLCTRTADGDVDHADFPYELEHAALRIDWDGESVELPYDVKKEDGWSKGFELSERWDGGRAGSWDGGATRKSSLSTDVVKVESWETSRLLRALARHAGPCFVRAPDGTAFEADVEVDTFGIGYDSAVLPVAVTATQVDLTAEFMAAAPDFDVEPETEE